MKSKDFEKLIKMMHSIIEMKDSLEKEEEEEDKDHECEIEAALKNEYMDIISWAFGKDFEGDTKGGSIEKWKNLHPDLPIPRVLKSKTEHPLSNTLGMLIDVVPLYNQHKKRKCKPCDNAN